MANITSWTDLAAINSNLSGNYVLTTDLSSSDADYASAGGNNWTPLGNASTKFTGVFDGQGFVINDLIVSKDTSDYNGLFGYASGATIKNVVLENCNVTGRHYTGSLCGNAENGAVESCFAQGDVDGEDNTGGLIGRCWDAIAVEKCFTDINVIGKGNAIGGFVGRAQGEGLTIDDCYSSGTVDGPVQTVDNAQFGGFAGYLVYGTITNSYASGTVSCLNFYVGGFCGDTYLGIFINCFATGDVTGTYNAPSTDYVGPFLGRKINGTGTITNSWYSAEAVITNLFDGTTNTIGTSTPNRADFYDATLDVYDTQAPNWDFTTPVWYEQSDNYPLFTNSVKVVNAGSNLSMGFI